MILLTAMFSSKLINPAIKRLPQPEIFAADGKDLAGLDRAKQPGRQLDLKIAQTIGEHAPFPVVFIFGNEPEATGGDAVTRLDICLNRDPPQAIKGRASRS